MLLLHKLSRSCFRWLYLSLNFSFKLKFWLQNIKFINESYPEWVSSECKTGSVAQSLSSGFSREGSEFDITAGQSLKYLCHYTYTSLDFSFLKVFLRTINLRSRLTILSNLLGRQRTHTLFVESWTKVKTSLCKLLWSGLEKYLNSTFSTFACPGYFPACPSCQTH